MICIKFLFNLFFLITMLIQETRFEVRLLFLKRNSESEPEMMSTLVNLLNLTVLFQ